MNETYRLIIGNRKYSSWSLRPWFWMKQAGVDFAEEVIPLYTENMESDLEPYFSNSKVPVLLINNTPIWDSLAILETLAERFSKYGWPADPIARAKARALSAEMHSSFTAMRSAMPMNCAKKYLGFKFSDAVLEDIRRIEKLWNYCRSDYGADGPWLFGRFSVADAMFAPVALRFWSMMPPDLGQSATDYIEMLLHNEHIQHWMKQGRREKEVLSKFELDSSMYDEVIEVKE